MRAPLTVVPYRARVPQVGVNRPPVLLPSRPGFGALSGNTTTIGTGAAQGAAVGTTILPGIGTAVGAVVGAIAGIFGGQSNPQIQIDKTNAINLFSQYQGIAGTVSGRSIGYENMDMILRGACFMGHFPGWGTETELPDSLMSMPGSPYGQNDNCFAVLWAAASKGVPAPGSSGKYTGNNGSPVRDAKTFVDNYVWPSNSSDVDTDPWVTNTDSIGKQIIYDAADAYIATQSSGTTPYIANPPVAATAPAVAAAPMTPMVNTGTVPAQNVTTAVTVASVPSGPSPPSVVETADGSEVTGPGTALETSNGTLLYFGPASTNLGYDIWEKSPASASPVQMGNAVGLVVGNGGSIYQVNANGTWYQWQNGNWTLLSGAPNLNGPVPTTSTSASAQSGVSCTVGSVPATTGAIVTTTAGGDAVTDDDIQDLISQMQAQGASSQATYTAVLQALADQGANVSAGVQSQVAGQVTATTAPSTATASSSSDTGVCIVGGGLALLALIYFMGQRRA
jgi:hypothetical protein